MKAYQVFLGDVDKHGRQQYNLVATYLDRQRALDHAKKIADETPLYGDELVEGEFTKDGKSKFWHAWGLEWIGLARFEEIEITE
jgi:hypothetical protein